MRSLFTRLPVHHLGLGAAILLIGSFLTIGSPYFLSTGNLTNIADSQAINALLAAGLTAVMMSGTVDLSFTGVMALAGMTAGLAAQHGLGGGIAVALALVVGIGGGFLNSLATVRLGINPIIGTLGAQFVFRGFAYIINDGAAVVVDDRLIDFLGRGRIGGVPTSVVISIAAYVGLLYALNLTRWGRHIRATGGNESAASRAGISTGRIRSTTFLLSGACAAVAGVVLIGFTGAANPQAGFGTEFVILGAVIVGGTSLMNSSTSGVGGTLLGMILFGVIFNGFNLLGVQPFWQQVATGVLLMGAVWADDARRRRSALV